MKTSGSGDPNFRLSADCQELESLERRCLHEPVILVVIFLDTSCRYIMDWTCSRSFLFTESEKSGKLCHFGPAHLKTPNRLWRVELCWCVCGLVSVLTELHMYLFVSVCGCLSIFVFVLAHVYVSVCVAIFLHVRIEGLQSHSQELPARAPDRPHVPRSSQPSTSQAVLH